MMTLNYIWKLARDQKLGLYSLVVEDHCRMLNIISIGLHWHIFYTLGFFVVIRDAVYTFYYFGSNFGIRHVFIDSAI